MRLPISIAIVLAAGRAAAQPVGGPPTGACEVTIVRAPDDVRAAIESWVAREAACRTPMEIRAIPTDGGIYLLGREPLGRLHERLVPDGQSAGVLVASWMADDSLDRIPLPGPQIVPVLLAPPALLDETASVRCTSAGCGARPVGSATPWAFGVTILPSNNSGARLRLGLDVLQRGELALGVVAAVTDTSYQEDFMHIHHTDVRALLAASGTLRSDPVRLRFQVGTGMVWSHAYRAQDSDWYAFPVEASVMIGYHAAEAWTMSIGPSATWYKPTSRAFNYAELPDRDVGVMMELRHER